MAKLPALVEALAKFDPRGVPTISNYARIIREAGLIPTTKRGPGASDMTVTEAANLILALAATWNANKAPEAVRVLRDALPVGAFEGEPDALEELCAYGIGEKASSLGEFLEECLRVFGETGMWCFPSTDSKSALWLKEIRLTSPDYMGCEAFFTFSAGADRSFVVHFQGHTERVRRILDETPRQDLVERLDEYTQNVPLDDIDLISFEAKLPGSAIAHVARSLLAAPKRRRAQVEEARDEI